METEYTKGIFFKTQNIKFTHKIINADCKKELSVQIINLSVSRAPSKFTVLIPDQSSIDILKNICSECEITIEV